MLTYEPVNKKWEKELCSLFEDLLSGGDYHFFHPHPLTASEAKKKIKYSGQDLYFLQISNGTLCGYGFLRGWDEGYEIPSLGLAIHPKFRGRGLGEKFIFFLHEQARNHGAKKVRLTVAADNKAAIYLYSKLGYRFCQKDETALEGFIEV